MTPHSCLGLTAIATVRQLTHYLDLVEVQIARQIADKSEAFFDAMSSHDSLMEQLTQAAAAVRALR